MNNNKKETESSFLNYELISSKEETILISSIKWATADRPPFITDSNYNRYKNKKNLVDHCFYIQEIDGMEKNLSRKIYQELQHNEKTAITGKFYRTKKFNGEFPYKEFSAYSFEPKNGYYVIFVYSK